VDYGTTTNYGSSTTFDATMTPNHNVTLTGLSQGALYNVRVRSKDANGVEVMGTNYQFSTIATSTNGPTISGISYTATQTSATITFTTDKGAKGQVDYGTTTAYGSSSALETSFTTSHSIAISSLTAGTTYNFRIRATDSGNNQTQTGNSSFSTTSAVDTTPPQISSVISSPASTSATITWTTNEASDSQAEYGTTTSYGQSTTLNTQLVTSHSVTISGLPGSTNYNFRVKSRDAAGNLATSGNFTFTTSSDTTPLVLSLISALPSSTSATITWTTNKLSDTQVDYGTTAAYGQSTALNTQLVTAHSTVLTGLSPSTAYNFRVKSADGSGNLATSGNFTFTTTAGGSTIPLGPGWTQLPNTQLQNVCPPNDSSYAFNSNCSQVIKAWSGGIADTARNRLIVWGGGHNDYYGNEIYALGMSDQKLIRLNNPGPVADPAANQVALSNGTPNSRHTYGGLTYIAHADRMFVYGGDPAATFGFASNDTWTLNLATLQWQRMDPTSGGPPANAYGVVSDYDPNTRNVYLHDGQTFWQYTYETNTYKSLDSSSSITIYNSAVVDPKRKLFFIIGSGMHVINIAPGSNYSMQDWTSQTSGCGTLQSTDYPGVAYDPVQDKIVGWTGGNSVYVFDPDAKTCTTVTNPNGPSAAQPNGTHGRFRYLPGLNAFIVVNDAQQNAYVLKF
jgi:hypothetical protein